MIHIIDDFLSNPMEYRERALAMPYRSYDFGHCVFHGIAVGEKALDLPTEIVNRFQHLRPILTFFRKSPHGQVEPHFIHTDIDMGEWSAILYLNPKPPQGDGTSFWKHRSGTAESLIPHERSEEGKTSDGWEQYAKVDAKFNRLLMFPSAYFHSRAIFDNWSNGEEARLTQVVFGKGQL